MANPGFRIRMVKQIPPDEWLCPGINYGCVIKFDDNGTVTESLWDPGGRSHPTITSVREHKGYLYIGGLENNRIGRIKLPNADPAWEAHRSYWGAA
jgi:ribose transport system permease protein